MNLKLFFKKPLNIYCLVIFLFVLSFSLLIPLGGDDWGSYLYKIESIDSLIDYIMSFYFSMEGRIFSRLFDVLLVPHAIIWALLNASLVTLLFFLFVKIMNLENKVNYMVLLILCLLMVDFETFAQVYVWHTGNVTYFIPMIFAVFLIYRRRKLFFEEDVVISKWDYLLVPLSLIFSMFVENVAVGIVMICLLNFIFYFKQYRKIDKPMALCFVFSAIGLCLMTFSPGSLNRLADSPDFASLSIFGKFMYNLPNLINYTFIKNSVLTIVLVITLIGMINKVINKKPLKILMLGYVTIIPGATALFNLINRFYEVPFPFNILLDASRWYVILFWILFLILFLVLLFMFLKNRCQNELYFLILAMASNGAMMISPTWGGRTAYFTTIMLSALCILILLKIDFEFMKSKKSFAGLNILLALFIIIVSSYSIIVYSFNKERINYINYQIKQKAQKYEIIILPEYFAWNLNTWGSDGYFAWNFKTAHNIPGDAKLIYIKKSDVKYDKKNSKGKDKEK